MSISHQGPHDLPVGNQFQAGKCAGLPAGTAKHAFGDIEFWGLSSFGQSPRGADIDTGTAALMVLTGFCRNGRAVGHPLPVEIDGRPSAAGP